MSDPKYNKYNGTVRFDDDNIVDIDLEPDTENIRVLLNGSEVTGGGSEVFYVDFSLVDPSAETEEWQSNKTYAEIMAAYNSGSNVIGRVVNPSQTTIYNLTAMYDGGATDKAIKFSSFSWIVDTNIVMENFYVAYNNSVIKEHLYVAFTE